jgi:hypothetical protein
MGQTVYGVNVPCHGCVSRSEICHASCPVYLEFVQKQRAAAEAYHREKKAVSDAYNVRGEGFERYRRAHHR